MEELFTIYQSLPFVMRKRFVSISHAVCVFLLLDCIAAIVRRVEYFRRQAIRHRLFATATRIRNNPPDCQRSASLLVHFHRHLIRRSTHAARFNFDRRLNVVDRPFENLQWLFAGLITDLSHGSVKNILRQRLLTHPHHAIDKLSYQRAAVDWIRQNFSSFGNSSSWHKSDSSYQRCMTLTVNLSDYFPAPALGRLAPYFERPCLRSETPTESSVPRIT